MCHNCKRSESGVSLRLYKGEPVQEVIVPTPLFVCRLASSPLKSHFSFRNNPKVIVVAIVCAPSVRPSASGSSSLCTGQGKFWSRRVSPCDTYFIYGKRYFLPRQEGSNSRSRRASRRNYSCQTEFTRGSRCVIVRVRRRKKQRQTTFETMQLGHLRSLRLSRDFSSRIFDFSQV